MHDDAPMATPRRSSSRFLPHLSWLLVILVAVLGIRSCLRRHSTDPRKRVAAFSQALRPLPQPHTSALAEHLPSEAAYAGPFAPPPALADASGVPGEGGRVRAGV